MNYFSIDEAEKNIQKFKHAHGVTEQIIHQTKYAYLVEKESIL